MFHRSCRTLPHPLDVAHGCSSLADPAVADLLKRFGAATSTLRSYIMFVATANSGHSLIGSLLDAHPYMIVSNEADALGWWYQALISQKRPPPRSEMFHYLYENSLKCALYSRWQHGHNYTVPHQANGLFPHGELLAIGDKKGGTTIGHLKSWEHAGILEKQWRQWEAYVALPITVIHVWWASQSSTADMYRQLVKKIVGAGNRTTAFEWNNTAFIHDPMRMIPQICQVLRVPCDGRLQRSWAAMVDPNKGKR